MNNTKFLLAITVLFSSNKILGDTTSVREALISAGYSAEHGVLTQAIVGSMLHYLGYQEEGGAKFSPSIDLSSLGIKKIERGAFSNAAISGHLTFSDNPDMQVEDGAFDGAYVSQCLNIEGSNLESFGDTAFAGLTTGYLNFGPDAPTMRALMLRTQAKETIDLLF